jgi:hypothetical protein
MDFPVDFGNCRVVELQIVPIAGDEVIAFSGFGVIKQEMQSLKMINHLVVMRGSVVAPDEVLDTPVRRDADEGYSNESRHKSRQDRRRKLYGGTVPFGATLHEKARIGC